MADWAEDALLLDVFLTYSASLPPILDRMVTLSQMVLGYIMVLFKIPGAMVCMMVVGYGVLDVYGEPDFRGTSTTYTCSPMMPYASCLTASELAGGAPCIDHTPIPVASKISVCITDASALSAAFRCYSEYCAFGLTRASGVYIAMTP